MSRLRPPRSGPDGAASGRAEDDLAALFAAAIGARERAYAPYSNFPVGSAVLSSDGRVFVGCNVENAAYPVGTCAEAGAIAAMVAGGARRIAAIVVVGAGPEPVVPCGACRQRISEFATGDTPVHLAGADGITETMTIADMLPRAFGPHALDAARVSAERGR